MAGLHQEISFEAQVCDVLAANGWLYEFSDAASYDRARALFPADLIAWVQATQPKAWESLSKAHGAAAEATLLDRVRKSLDDRGTLDVLRNGIEMIGVRQPVALAQFRPAMRMNPDILARYDANRLRVVRQVRYSLANEKCIDIVLFLNGLPVATVELKTDFTQGVRDAVDQYRFDRLPRDKGAAPEPLLSFPSGALVHFAVSDREVMMTTKLEGPASRFLPFNQGDHGGKGNPTPPFGHPTAYLWEQVWQRDSWLEIMGRYLVTQRDKKRQITTVLFPRYHQLDATRKLQAAVLAEGAGGKFLIQHSAGSGKTNSIAWSAHFLSELHDAKDEKLFSTVIVVSDRRVIDGQLQDAIFDFERTQGVVAVIKNDGGGKGDQLAVALAAGKKIIVCTKGIIRWVRLHEYNIAQKVQIVVEHFRKNVAPLLDGKAKAMVVLASRQEAVRWKLAIDKYIREQGYRLGTLVAFSGEVNDPQSGPEAFSETNPTLNPGLKGRDIRDAFKGDEFHLLLVANKFQTGFDQPLLCGMYVDRRLAGIQAVQTLSRLNRAHPGKDTTYVLDFADSADEVLAAFKTYYETAALEGTTDPNLVFDLRAKLDAAGHYDDFEVDRVARVLMDPTSKHGDLAGAVGPTADRLLKRYSAAKAAKLAAADREEPKAIKAAQDEMDALILFKSDMATFVRVYTFLSQIIDYANPDIEKRFLFFKHLIRLLEFGRERDTVDLSQLVLTHHTVRSLGRRPFVLGDGDAPTITPVGEAGSGSVQEKQRALLAEIIAKVNDLFTGELTDDDRLVYVNSVLKGKLLASDALVTQAMNNSKPQFANSPTLDKALEDAIMDALDAHQMMSTQALNSDRVRAGLKSILLGPAGLYEALRGRGPDAAPGSSVTSR